MNLELGTAGLHLLVVTVQWEVNSSGGRDVTLRVRRAGSLVAESPNVAAPTAFGSSIMQVTLLHIAEPGDQVEVKVRQSSGANLDVLAANTFLQVARLAQ